jgi:S1-C subfamily serine protease
MAGRIVEKQMWMQHRNNRRFVAIGLVGIIGLVCLHAGRAVGEEPPPQQSGSKAVPTKRPQDNPAPKDDADTPAKARSVELSTEAVRRGKAATALIELRSIGSGSSVCVSVDGFFITNHHVVVGAGLGENVRLVVAPGQKGERVLVARVVKLDEENDLALLKADAAPGLVALSLGTDDQLYETMPLAAFGYPFGRMLAADKGYPAVSVNTGAVTALRKKGDELSMIQLDASVNPGNSGGPVIDGKGNLIGIIASGIVMAKVNFAIPVSRVREFLSGPALVLRYPRLVFPDRTKSRRFEIDAYALDPRLLGEIAVELSLTDSTNDARTLAAKRIGNAFVAEGPPCSPGGPAIKPILIVQKGRGRIQTALPAGGFSLGGRVFPWGAVDSLVKDGDESVVSLLDGGRFAGKPAGLPEVRYGDGRTTQLATADRIDVRLDHAPATEVVYEIQASRGSKAFAPIQGRLLILDTPKGLTPGFDQPVVRSEVRQPIVIEAVVPELLMLGVAPSGLAWVPGPGAPPGMENEQGRYVLVNGQPWYIEQMKQRLPNENVAMASLWRILLGIRDCQIRLLWARPEGGGAHDGGRVSAEVKKSSETNITTVTIKNRAQQPTRVAVAVSFDPPKAILPIPPPRTRPVLESHWPLNDQEPTQAADLGPGKHTGRSSAARTVPGVRGDAVRIDRQPVLCPGVLPIDRNDPFTCTAWVNPNPAENMTIFGRMNYDLRGFDLNYTGTVQAHFISSWDGNAIRVNTIERFDPLQWHHVALTYDGSSLARGLNIYLDGAPATLEVTVDRLSETIKCDFPFSIGGRERREYYQGRVDEVRAYDRTLSADEIFELYDLERSNLDPSAGSTLRRGLVGYWPFDGPSAESFEDKSGHGHPGRPVPDEGLPEVVASDGGQVLRLGGLGAVDCGDVGDFERDQPYSLGGWFKPGDGYKSLLATLDRENRGYDLFMVDGHIFAHLLSEWEGNALRVVSRSTYPNDIWHHVVCTYDGSSRGAGMHLYVDGAESPCEISHDSLKSTTKSHGYFRIGSRSDRHYFVGDIDDVFVYRRALSATEARTWFERKRNSARPLAADQKRGLAGFWTFEGKGEEAYRDHSGNGHHGQPDLHSAHAAIVPQGPARVGRFRSNGGIDCGQAGDFERTDPFSAGGWFFWEGGPTENLFSKIHHSGPNRGYAIEYDGEKYTAQLIHNWDDGPENALAIQSPSIRGSGWRHVMFTYDGSSRAAGLKLYVNSELQKVNVLKDSLSKSIRVQEPFVIGSRLVASTFYGRVANVRVIPRVLTADQVRQLANADRPPGPLP